jgi:hypothetical protein
MLAASESYVFLSLLPFLLLIGFTHLFTRNARSRMQSAYEPFVAKLEEIRAELERLRKTMERRDDDSGFGFRS